MDNEICRANLGNLAQYYSDNVDNRNEATTRLQLIDQLFFECLGWSREDCTSEESSDGLYADYTFSTTRRVLIVEAKREGEYFEVPIEIGQHRRERSLSSLCADNPRLKDAVGQVARYCQQRGVPLGMVCNGHQLVAFIATRQDGTPPLKGRSLVFLSFEDMLSDYLSLWNSLSKAGITRGILEMRMLGQNSSPIPPKLSTTIIRYPGVKNRNPFQADLKAVSDLVLEDLAKGQELEEQFLRECYCQSGALSQHALISKEILRTRYAAIFDAQTPTPTLVPAVTKAGVTEDLISHSLSQRPILLIGDVGVGKTTFIRHLIKIEAKDLFDDALTLYLDQGTQGTLTGDLKDFVLEEMRHQLLDSYGIDIETRDFVRGIYHLDLERFEKGIYGSLKDTNLNTYREKELVLS